MKNKTAEHTMKLPNDRKIERDLELRRRHSDHVLTEGAGGGRMISRRRNLLLLIIHTYTPVKGE